MMIEDELLKFFAQVVMAFDFEIAASFVNNSLKVRESFLVYVRRRRQNNDETEVSEKNPIKIFYKIRFNSTNYLRPFQTI